MADNTTYDLVVIGAGPGGYVAAIRAAQLGLKTACVEKEYLGGTCLNVGCIPSKALLASAERLDELRHAGDLGIKVNGEVSFDWSAVMNHKERTVRQLRGGVELLMKTNGITVFKGTGSLMARDRVRVEGADGAQELTARNVILATGSVEARPPIPGLDLPGVIGSTQALSIDDVPSSIVIIGGGILGCEFASIFSHFGAKVTVIEMMDRIIPLEDADLGAGLARAFGRQGIDVKTGAKVLGITQQGEGLRVEYEANGQKTTVDAPRVLVAIGRVPYTEGLGLDRIGVAMDRRFVKVDDHLRTSVPGIWAIGDLTGKVMLAHVASAQGEVAVENIMGHERTMDYSVVPSCGYMMPQAASVGLSEAKAREAGHEVKVGTFPFQASGRAIASRSTEGFVKVVADEKWGRILGVHVLHPRASDVIEEAVVAMKLESSIEDLVAAIHPHPTFTEAIAEAALAAESRAIHLPPKR
jgi:dihydrolipoamide dehydrogenase